MNIDSDLWGQIQKLINAAGGLGLACIGMAAFFVLFLGFLGKRKVLLGCYLVAVVFSGFSVQSVDTGFRLFRWFVMFVLAMTAFRGIRSPGRAVMIFGMVGIYGLVVSFQSPAWFYSFQLAFLSVVFMLGVAPTLSHEVSSEEDIHVMMKLLVFAAVIWILLALASLGSLREGSRFSGSTNSAPVFVLTGGMLMPAALWGAWSFRNTRLRILSGGVLSLLFLLCVLSGQRTGTFAGIIACLPLLARFGVKQILGVTVLLGVLGGAILIVFSVLGEQGEFVTERFASANLTGRWEIWQVAWNMCIREPWFGHGWGVYGYAGFFHNLYLTMWYTGGIGSVLLTMLALATLFYDAWRLQRHTSDPFVKNLSRYAMGSCLGIMGAACFDASLESPSNIVTFAFVFTSILAASGHVLAQGGGAALEYVSDCDDGRDICTQGGDDAYAQTWRHT